MGQAVAGGVHPEITLLFDGDCPLCAREVRFMRRFNRAGRLALEDIAAPGFDPRRYGLSQAEVMGQIHAVLPDGTLLTGMEAFRRSYAALGLGGLLAPTGWAPLRPLFDRAYTWFARNRLRLTGRGQDCAEDRCALGSRH